MSSEEAISDEATRELDYHFRSLTCLGEILYNEKVHEEIHAQGPGHQQDLPDGLHKKGSKLVLQLSRLLVRQPGENVTFAVIMSNGGIEMTVATTDTSPTQPKSSDDGPRPDDFIQSSQAYTNSPPAGKSDPPFEVPKLQDRPDTDAMFEYLLKYFQPYHLPEPHPPKDKEKKDKEKYTIPFDVHVRNTLKLLVSCSAQNTSTAARAAANFFYYTACMGIAKWKSRYTVDPIVKKRFGKDDISFDDFLLVEHLLPAVDSDLKKWPETRINNDEKRALLSFLAGFAKLFDYTYEYQDSKEGKKASKKRESRKEIAQNSLKAAREDAEEGRLNGNANQFYHITLGQAFSDAKYCSERAMD